MYKYMYNRLYEVGNSQRFPPSNVSYYIVYTVFHLVALVADIVGVLPHGVVQGLLVEL